MDRITQPAPGAGHRLVAIAALALGLALIAGLTTAAPAGAMQDRDGAEQTISPALGEGLLELLEMEESGAWLEVEAGYTRLIEERALTPYERAVLLRQRGRARYELERLDAAISDWRSVIALAVLPDEDANALRINTGQLLMAAEDFRAGINLIEAAIDCGTPLTVDLAVRLAQAHGRLDDHTGGLPYARTAFTMAESGGGASRNQFSLLLYFYQQLERTPEQLGLMEQMVTRWPAEKANWTSYASLLAQVGRETDAFEVNRIMYLNGMLNSSQELVRLAQYYSYYDYPYGGAVMLEREINAGRVEAETANMQLLANLWRHAREWERALPVLERVATTSGAGPDYETYGEALFQAGNFREAEAVFVQAINRGGLSRPGDTWTYLGNVRVEMDAFNAAEQAFLRALDWEYSRAGAQGWLQFISSKRRIMRQGAALERTITIESCELAIQRARLQVVVSEDEYDSEGLRVLDLPEMCEPWFDTYGHRRPESDRI
jgi:tetratricopeptide (TPR) repeat protein